jgi:hypothetical protein
MPEPTGRKQTDERRPALDPRTATSRPRTTSSLRSSRHCSSGARPLPRAPAMPSLPSGTRPSTSKPSTAARRRSRASPVPSTSCYAGSDQTEAGRVTAKEAPMGLSDCRVEAYPTSKRQGGSTSTSWDSCPARRKTKPRTIRARGPRSTSISRQRTAGHRRRLRADRTTARSFPPQPIVMLRCWRSAALKGDRHSS